MRVFDGDIFGAVQPIIAVQVNINGYFDDEILKKVKTKYPDCYLGYYEYCERNMNSRMSMLGRVILLTYEEGRMACLFSRYTTVRYETNLVAFKTALVELIRITQLNDESIAIPYKFGALDENEWESIQEIINEVVPDGLMVMYEEEE